jgi:hypothetical protein
LKNRILVISLAILILLSGLVVACSQDAKTSSKEQYRIKVFQNNTLVASLRSDDLKALEQVSFFSTEKDREVKGPSLLYVLNWLGIDDFTRVTVIGLARGRKSDAEFILDRQQFGKQVILTFSGGGRVKLAGTDIPWDAVIDVSEVRVE